MRNERITVRYCGPGETTGSRMRVRGLGHVATYPFDYSASDPFDAAVAEFVGRFDPAVGVEEIGQAGATRAYRVIRPTSAD